MLFPVLGSCEPAAARSFQFSFSLAAQLCRPPRDRSQPGRCGGSESTCASLSCPPESLFWTRKQLRLYPQIVLPTGRQHDATARGHGRDDQRSFPQAPPLDTTPRGEISVDFITLSAPSTRVNCGCITTKGSGGRSQHDHYRCLTGHQFRIEDARIASELFFSPLISRRRGSPLLNAYPRKISFRARASYAVRFSLSHFMPDPCNWRDS